MSSLPPRLPSTLGALVDADKGVNMRCACGHCTAYLPAQIVAIAPPGMRLADFRRQFRCSRCGRTGTEGAVTLVAYDVTTGFVDRRDVMPHLARPAQAARN